MTYDEYLDSVIRNHTDAPQYLWDYTYQCEQDLHRGLGRAETKSQAIINLEYLIDELQDTLEYIKEMDEYALA